MQELLGFIKEGGFIMAPLIFCSVLAWAVAFEKFRFLSKIQGQIEGLFSHALELLKEKKVHEAKGLAHQLHPLLKKIYLDLFELPSGDKQKDQERFVRHLTEGQMGLKKSLWIIGTIGSTSPFIGLFGTVVGIIRSFDSIAKAGKSGFAVVAADLSEALVATAAGILVAVMAVVLFNYFQGRIGRMNVRMKNQLEDLRDLI